MTAVVNEQRTEFTSCFYLPETSRWKKLATFSTITGGKPLAGYYSFVEDFRRNRTSATHPREARVGNAWVRDEQGQWQSVTAAKFTAHSNPALNINAGERDGKFFLVTGGDTKNDATPLRQSIELPLNKPATVPDDLPSGTLR